MPTMARALSRYNFKKNIKAKTCKITLENLKLIFKLNEEFENVENLFLRNELVAV